MKAISYLPSISIRTLFPLIMIVTLIIALFLSYKVMHENQIIYLKKEAAISIQESFKVLTTELSSHIKNETINKQMELQLEIYAKSNKCDVGIFTKQNRVIYTNNPSLKLWTPPYMKMLRALPLDTLTWKKKHFLAFLKLKGSDLYIAYHKDLDFESASIDGMAWEMLKIFSLILFIGLSILGAIFYFFVTKRVKILLNIISQSEEKSPVLFENRLKGRDEIASIAKAFYSLISKLNISNKEMKQNIHKFNLLNEMSPDAIFILAPDHTLYHYNQQLCRFLGSSKEDLSDLDITSLLGGHTEETNNLFKEAFSGKAIDVESICNQEDGVFPVRMRLRTILMDSSSYVLGFLTDICKEKEAHEQMLRQAKKAQMGEMISIIAHQWKQPLSVISTMSNNIKMTLLLEDRDINTRDKMDQINNVVNHLVETMHTFTNFFNPNKKKNMTNMKVIVEKSLQLMQESLKVSDITIKVDIPNKNNFLSFEDELVQVVLDIIKNALDFLMHNALESPKIEFKEELLEGYICLSISDNAGGIPDDVLPHLFDSYFTTKVNESGTGLGLHMSKIIVEEHCNGKIEAIQIPSGACFKISIPIGAS